MGCCEIKRDKIIINSNLPKIKIEKLSSKDDQTKTELQKQKDVIAKKGNDESKLGVIDSSNLNNVSKRSIFTIGDVDRAKKTSPLIVDRNGQDQQPDKKIYRSTKISDSIKNFGDAEQNIDQQTRDLNRITQNKKIKRCRSRSNNIFPRETLDEQYNMPLSVKSLKKYKSDQSIAEFNYNNSNHDITNVEKDRNPIKSQESQKSNLILVSQANSSIDHSIDSKLIKKYTTMEKISDGVGMNLPILNILMNKSKDKFMPYNQRKCSISKLSSKEFEIELMIDKNEYFLPLICNKNETIHINVLDPLLQSKSTTVHTFNVKHLDSQCNIKSPATGFKFFGRISSDSKSFEIRNTIQNKPLKHGFLMLKIVLPQNEESSLRTLADKVKLNVTNVEAITRGNALPLFEIPGTHKYLQTIIDKETLSDLEDLIFHINILRLNPKKYCELCVCDQAYKEDYLLASKYHQILDLKISRELYLSIKLNNLAAFISEDIISNEYNSQDIQSYKNKIDSNKDLSFDFNIYLLDRYHDPFSAINYMVFLDKVNEKTYFLESKFKAIGISIERTVKSDTIVVVLSEKAI